ncbi:hypothetical protein [Methylocaldum sp.]|uniref:hypothetical protein n=1 Tax=Methylocaldum sp. TaxID=1969727 RepID=UPI002D5BF656|nr:hypothetical protein [Methylocaldum sp.]HYE38169.1 hypothetical protein [Methylocaldum sp.]
MANEDTTFNVDAFQNAQFSDANSTEYVPVPVGEFPAVIDKQAIRQAKQSIILDVTWKIDSEEVARETGIENPTVRQSIFLDVNENGNLEFGKGKNVQLGRLREALGQNVAGQPWTFSHLVGQVAKVRIAHRADTTSTPGNTIMRAEVAGVTKL